MKVICCRFLGCRWYGLAVDQNKHEHSCKYGNTSGLELIKLLESTDFDQRLPGKINYNAKIVKNILPMFESDKLAAIDFEIKDVRNMLMHSQAYQINTMNKCTMHDHSVTLMNLATQREINNINMLFGLVELLIIGQKPTNDIYPWGYENSWVIYESGTAVTLGETISVKVTAHVYVGYDISLSYNINFHGPIKRDFLLGHVLMDGSEFGGDIIPKAVATHVTADKAGDHTDHTHNLFPCLLSNCESSAKGETVCGGKNSSSNNNNNNNNNGTNNNDKSNSNNNSNQNATNDTEINDDSNAHINSFTNITNTGNNCNNTNNKNTNVTNEAKTDEANEKEKNANSDDDKMHSSGSSGCSSSTAFFQSQQVYIDFEKPIHIYQMLLGKRKLGFRLFLFDGPPNAESLCIEQRSMKM